MSGDMSGDMSDDYSSQVCCSDEQKAGGISRLCRWPEKLG